MNKPAFDTPAPSPAPTPLRVLLLEDSRFDAELVLEALKRVHPHAHPTWVRDEDGFVAALSEGSFDVILSDVELPGFSGAQALDFARALRPEVPFVFVEGNADLTPQKLIGYHDPAQVMRHGYRREDFVAGPLPDAMQRGGFLYIEEFNRVPEDTLNALLTAMAERELTVPRVGRIAASDSFRLVAAMNRSTTSVPPG